MPPTLASNNVDRFLAQHQTLQFPFPPFFFLFPVPSDPHSTSAAFNLINDIDLPETEKRLANLRQENAAFTALNAQRDVRDALSVQAEEERIWREQQERAKEARLEEEEERLEREREKKEIIDSLVSGSKSAKYRYLVMNISQRNRPKAPPQKS